MVEVEGRIGGETEVGLGIWIGWGWHIFSTACFLQFWLLLLYYKPQPVHTQRNRGVSFSVLCSHFRISYSGSFTPVYAGTDDFRQYKCLFI